MTICRRLFPLEKDERKWNLYTRDSIGFSWKIISIREEKLLREFLLSICSITEFFGLKICCSFY